MKELRTINFEDKVFECGGRKFFIRESLSFVRYRELQKISLEFGYSATFADIFNNLGKAVESFNKHRYDEMVITIHNIRTGIAKLESKDDPALRLCALFIDEEGEDPTVYDEGKMSDKIACWGGELDSRPFFHLAASLVLGWMPAYLLTIQNGSKEESQESEKPDQ